MSEATIEPAGSAERGVDLPVSNQSRILSMLWIGFYTTILNIFTLTIFRFWGRTHFRRRLWADTYVGKDSLEYTGRGMELFIGFLIAIFTLMVPFVGALLAAQLLLGPEFLAIVIIPMYLALFVIIGIAIFLARRYHLSRTRFRGMRFAQTGSAVGYGFAAFGYGLLSAITLGWFGPEARLRLSRKMWDHAYFGSAKFSFAPNEDAMKEPVYASFAVAWVGGIVAYGVWIFWFISSMGGDNFDPAATQDIEFIARLYASMIPLVLIIAVAVAWHEAVMIRRIIKSLEVGGVRLSSRISTMDIIELAITNVLLLIVTLGFGYMAIQMRVWKRIANRMSLEGEIDFAAIKQNEDQAPSQGEGLADGLDLVSNF
ncbi:MAG: DUF898 family protein [Pseudomonadota bacterium]